jgi:dolichyl-phosphate-mannose-protein mannosyltransferase
MRRPAAKISGNMTLTSFFQAPAGTNPPAWRYGLWLLLALSLGLHFWGLSRFNVLVFDEVYFPKFGHNYFHGQGVFDVHPPLGKLIVGLGMWLGDAMGYGDQLTNTLSGAARAPWSYRWMSALFGSTLPLLTCGIAWELTKKWRMALLSGLMVLLAGLFLVESRYGLINVIMIAFGLAGHWLWLRGLSASTTRQRWREWALAGVSLGACVSVKWNGLAFIGVIGLMTLLAWQAAWLRRPATESASESASGSALAQFAPARYFGQLRLSIGIVCFAIIPGFVYLVQWIPHLALNEMSFTETHWQIANYHKNLKDGGEHPYCSRWSSWPIMGRPVSYLFEVARDSSDPLPPYPVKPTGAEAKVTYAVHAITNPLLAWWSCIALLAMLAAWGVQPKRWGGFRMQVEASTAALRNTAKSAKASAASIIDVPDRWRMGYILMCFGASWLPWAVIGRCQFIYHFMPSLVFAMIAAAWAIDTLISQTQRELRWAGYAVLATVTGNFIFFAPLYLGLAMPSKGFYWRMWFTAWI